VQESLVIQWGVASAMFLLTLTYKRKWAQVWKEPKSLLLAAGLGFVLNDFFYFLAFRYAPAAEVELVNWLWPIFTIFAGMVMDRKHVHWRYGLYGLLGFLSVCLVLPWLDLSDWPYAYWGMGLALLSALSWVVFLLVSTRMPDCPTEVLGLYMGIAATFFLMFQGTQGWLWPTSTEMYCLIWCGVLSSGIGYWFWASGVKGGAVWILSVCAYFSPILSIMWLCLLGYAKFSWALGFAIFAIICILLKMVFEQKRAEISLA
jgi:drug/metabolite transporter (DMT)-like permease